MADDTGTTRIEILPPDDPGDPADAMMLLILEALAPKPVLETFRGSSWSQE